jgi:mRNA interferase RelE/StbE
MAWTVEFDPQAEKELDRLDSQQAKRILKYLFERIATDKDPRRFGDPLRSNLAGLWKYRVGDYRVICEIQDEVLLVLVVRVGHRRKVYK